DEGGEKLSGVHPAGGGRGDSAVEFSCGDRGGNDGGFTGDGEYGGAEAGGRYADSGSEGRGDCVRRGHSKRGAELFDRRGEHGGRRAGAAPKNALRSIY